MSIRLPVGTHLVDDRGHACHGRLPGRFRPGKSTPDNVDHTIVHGLGC